MAEKSLDSIGTEFDPSIMWTGGIVLPVRLFNRWGLISEVLPPTFVRIRNCSLLGNVITTENYR